MNPLCGLPSRSVSGRQNAMESLMIPPPSSILFSNWQTDVRTSEVTMRSLYKFFVFAVVLGLSMAAGARSDGSEPAAPAASHNEAAIERIFLQEAKLVENMHSYTPMVETYI